MNLETKPDLIQEPKDFLVLYHTDCLDGFASAYVAWLYFKDPNGEELADYIPVMYNTEPPDVTGKYVYLLDFTYEEHQIIEMSKIAKNIVIIDHHPRAEEILKTVSNINNIDIEFKKEKSGCVLAWEYFFGEEFKIPQLLFHIQDRDLWQFKLEDTKEICEALYSLHNFNFEEWDKIITDWNIHSRQLLIEGEISYKILNNEVEKLSNNAHLVTINGIIGLACNANRKYESVLGNLLANSSGTFGMVYYFNGEVWKCSLRSIGDFKVNELAKLYNGGGHDNASGFKLSPIDFMSFSMKELDHFEIIKNLNFNNIIPNAFEFTGISLQKTIECFEIDIAKLKRKRIIELLTELLELDKKLIEVENLPNKIEEYSPPELILKIWFKNNNIEIKTDYEPLSVYFTILGLNFKYSIDFNNKCSGLYYQKYNKEVKKYMNYQEEDNLESEDYFKLEDLSELLIP